MPIIGVTPAEPQHRHLGSRRVLLALLIAAIVVAAAPPARAASPPVGFSDQLVAFVQSPTAVAWTPDGRMLINSKEGALRIYENGALLPDPALDLSSVICADSERGLLGVAVDPDFATNHYIYLYYTFKKYGVCPSRDTPNTPVNRVSRFVLDDDDTVDIAQRDGPDRQHPLGRRHPQRGRPRLRQGRQPLRISVGDGGCDFRWRQRLLPEQRRRPRPQHPARQDPAHSTGRRHPGATTRSPGAGTDRCNVTGSTTVDRKCQEIYASGLRNPFRIAFDPDARGHALPHQRRRRRRRGRRSTSAQAGADYGWNVREGPCAKDSYDRLRPAAGRHDQPVTPTHTNTRLHVAITAGDFVPGRDLASRLRRRLPVRRLRLRQALHARAGRLGRLTPRADFATGIGTA